MGLLGLFAGTIFLSAVLLFSLQPMFGKMVLPILGGSPAVWNTCMLFFQTMLLAGYGYAHFVVRRLQNRSQLVLHLLVVWIPILLLPVIVPSDWTPPTEGTPVLWLLMLLTVSVGGPFFAISATTPLLQSWFARTPHPAARDPYFLYGASNLGSMLALLCYPLLVEPRLRLVEQGHWWTGGYIGLCVLMVACVVVVWRRYGFSTTRSDPDTRDRSNALSKAQSAAASLSSAKVTTRQRLGWVALSFVPSSWMLGVTTFLTTDIAPIPLLWVIPLSLYLLTFILVFARRSILPHRWMVRLFPFAIILLSVSVIFVGSWIVLLLHLIVFFIGSMVCHGKLVRSRPMVSHLTEFYLWISIGGMLGGLLNALLAPLLFSRLLEYPLTVLLACLLLNSLNPDNEEREQIDPRHELALLAGFAVVFAVIIRSVEFQGSELLVWLTIGFALALIILYLTDRPRAFALCAGLLLMAGEFDHPFAEKILVSRRSFFGLHRVLVDSGKLHWLQNGRIIHGVQSRVPQEECIPLAYYHPTGPLGEIFDAFQKSRKSEPVAVVGLGTGAAICYQQPGQQFTFYEIDPVVKQIAEAPEYFTYLSRCGKGEYTVILGDGRLKLAEAKNEQFGLILLDAFSSDAIPTHLLTREAFRIYLSKLNQNGLLAFHISNTHLNLEPVVAKLASDAGLVCLICDDLPFSERESEANLKFGKFPSRYMVAARKLADLEGLIGRPNWFVSRPQRGGSVWTDDYSNVLEILNW
ncbi:MAG: fused MFS/spermidine synthase [Planctomycetes bacterium]|nr:fused MFS/spermidine synthase [Planctomycetota bacterium]